MKAIKIVLSLFLALAVFSANAQVGVTVDIGGHGYYHHGVFHGPGVIRYRNYYAPRYYPVPISAPTVIYKNYDTYPEVVRVPVYCLDSYGQEYFCGYRWVRQ